MVGERLSLDEAIRIRFRQYLAETEEKDRPPLKKVYEDIVHAELKFRYSYLIEIHKNLLRVFKFLHSIMEDYKDLIQEGIVARNGKSPIPLFDKKGIKTLEEYIDLLNSNDPDTLKHYCDLDWELEKLERSKEEARRREAKAE